ncbi:glycosyltransferase family 39 protein [Streptomyces inhibens]|uniref:Polyprenyl phospho-mannosyltransferase MppI n=1 Tax=Streptomyces hygroscopicus TaxID=1912 RepID=Q643C9_STRHY|nr:glycosyltransferase family 39 protein [Streptomyces inhibens]AAU34200.1 polyprenyl phospho-mannosyltransferase MppI [Streptomyces hygroscopicus]UKY51824.1 glycosyltransferase family 39 protein [Streptomyces inhibens]
MTTSLDRDSRAAAAGPGVFRPAPMAWRPVAVVVAALAVLLFAFAGEYGYHADELYFRLLGVHGFAWGYVDQPPLLPLAVRTSMEIFGDSMWAIRVPAVLCAAAVTALGAMIAAELGGSRRAQTLTAFGVATSTMVLSFGHWILTTSFDTVAWAAVLLFVMRVLLRGESKWWLWAGVVVGVALYAKYIVLLLPVALLVGLALVGPRKVFRDGKLYAGTALALVIGSPNLIYQATHDFPQLQMAEGLAGTDGEANRAMFATNLILLFGPALFVLCMIGLVKLFRVPEWKPVRTLAVGYLAATAASYLIEGGRPDYTGGLLIALLAAGCVTADRWAGARKLRLSVLAVSLTLSTAVQMLLSLPVIPKSSLRDFQIASMALETVGWPRLVQQTEAAYRALPAADRDRAIVLTENFGEAGALDHYGHGLPKVYSGHNELYHWGPPPQRAEVVVAVGIDRNRLSADFTSCKVVDHIDNRLGIDNPEQGVPITVCHGPKKPWSALWPTYRHYNAYL